VCRIVVAYRVVYDLERREETRLARFVKRRDATPKFGFLDDPFSVSFSSVFNDILDQRAILIRWVVYIPFLLDTRKSIILYGYRV